MVGRGSGRSATPLRCVTFTTVAIGVSLLVCLFVLPFLVRPVSRLTPGGGLSPSSLTCSDDDVLPSTCLNLTDIQDQLSVMTNSTIGCSAESKLPLDCIDVDSLRSALMISGSNGTIIIGDGLFSFTEGSAALFSSPNGTGIINGSPLGEGQIYIGQSDPNLPPVPGSIIGTPNQVIVTTGGGVIQFSLPQDVDPAAAPTFSQITLTNTSDQIIAGDATINVQGNNTYTIPDAGADANVVMSTDGVLIITNQPSGATDFLSADSTTTASWKPAVGNCNCGLATSVGVESDTTITSFTETTPTLVTSMTLSLPAGKYKCDFSATSVPSTSSVMFNVALYVDGVQRPTSVRTNSGSSSYFNIHSQTLVTSASTVTVEALWWRNSMNPGTANMYARNLICTGAS